MALSMDGGAPFETPFRTFSSELQTSLLTPAFLQQSKFQAGFRVENFYQNHTGKFPSNASFGTGTTEPERQSSIGLLHAIDLTENALIRSDEEAAEAELVSKTLEMLSLIRRSTPNPNSSLSDLLDGQSTQRPKRTEFEYYDPDEEMYPTDGDEYLVGVEFDQEFQESSREQQQEEWIKRALVRRDSLPLSSTQTETEDCDEDEIFDMEL